MAELFRGVQGPVWITQKFSRHEYHVGLLLPNNLISLARFGNQSHGAC